MDFTKEDFDSVFGVEQNKLRTEMRDDIAVRVLIAMIETTPEAAQRVTEKAIFDLSRAAYLFADAMMAAREGEKKATPEEVVKALQTPFEPVQPRPVFKNGDRVRMSGIPTKGLGTVVGEDKIPRVVGFVTVEWDDGRVTWEIISSLELAK